MMNTILKIYEKILDNRLRESTLHKISKLQGGGQPPNIGTIDTLLTIQEIINTTKKQQLILCSYDLSKARMTE